MINGDNREFLPDVRIIIGRVVSMVVAPPPAIGASFPKYFTIACAKAMWLFAKNISEQRNALQSMPLYSVIRTLESERSQIRADGQKIENRTFEKTENENTKKVPYHSC